MSRPAAKGWCPSALRPMKSGDGLLVRIKPNFGQLNSKQLLVLADCLDDFGNGLLDITSRTNLQIRGVKEQNYSNLILKLQAEGLLGKSEKLDRLNVIVPPFIRKIHLHGVVLVKCILVLKIYLCCQKNLDFASIARKVVTLLINQAIYLLKGVLALGSY